MKVYMEQNSGSRVNGVFTFAMEKLFLHQSGEILVSCGNGGCVLS